jgi:hypothetical protein
LAISTLVLEDTTTAMDVGSDSGAIPISAPSIRTPLMRTLSEGPNRPIWKSCRGKVLV